MPKHCTAFLATTLLVLATAHSAGADGVAPKEALTLGFSPSRLERIDRVMQQRVDKGDMAGVVLLVARHGKIAHFSAIGYADVETKRKLQKDAMVRLYSMTKPITATALMMLYEEGKFQLNDPVSKYIPEFATLRVLRTPQSAADDTVDMVRQPTVHDLLRHTAGFVHTGGDYDTANILSDDMTLAEEMTKLATLPLRYQPGTLYKYSLAPDVEARLVEIFSGLRFDEFLQQRLFNPLGMKDTGYGVSADKAARIATVHWQKDGKLVALGGSAGYPGQYRGRETLFERYTQVNPKKGGASGLMGTAQDYWRFAQMMLDGGYANGRRFLSPNTIGYMARNHMGSIPMSEKPGESTGYAWGLGFGVQTDPVAAEVLSTEGTFFWAGAASTWFWIDPKKDLVVVIMTQHFETPTLNSPALRGQLSAMIYSALME